MPCIKKRQSGQGNIWEAYCGKTVWLCNNPFDTPEIAMREQKKHGTGICPTCRKNAKLPAPERKKKVEFVEYPVYVVANGVIKENTVVKETRTGIRLSNGDLVTLGRNDARRVISDQLKGAAQWVYITKSKEEAIAYAKEQLEDINNLAYTLLGLTERRGKRLLFESKDASEPEATCE